jgi:hypothetical protein
VSRYRVVEHTLTFRQIEVEADNTRDAKRLAEEAEEWEWDEETTHTRTTPIPLPDTDPV